MRAGQLPIDQQVTHFQAALRNDRTLAEVPARAATMNLPGWYLDVESVARLGRSGTVLAMSGFRPPLRVQPSDVVLRSSWRAG